MQSTAAMELHCIQLSVQGDWSLFVGALAPGEAHPPMCCVDLCPQNSRCRSEMTAVPNSLRPRSPPRPPLPSSAIPPRDPPAPTKFGWLPGSPPPMLPDQHWIRFTKLELALAWESQHPQYGAPASALHNPLDCALRPICIPTPIVVLFHIKA